MSAAKVNMPYPSRLQNGIVARYIAPRNSKHRVSIAQPFRLPHFSIQLSLLILLKIQNIMDPFSVIASAIGIAGVGGQAVQAVQSARDVCGNYRHAAEQMQHAKAKSDMLESFRQNSSMKSNPKLAVAQSSFEAISSSFPENLHPSSKRRRLLWAAKDKERTTKLLAQLTEIETSAILSLHLDQSYV
jgi:hypothetical protein